MKFIKRPLIIVPYAIIGSCVGGLIQMWITGRDFNWFTSLVYGLVFGICFLFVPTREQPARRPRK